MYFNHTTTHTQINVKQTDKNWKSNEKKLKEPNYNTQHIIHLFRVPIRHISRCGAHHGRHSLRLLMLYEHRLEDWLRGRRWLWPYCRLSRLYYSRSLSVDCRRGWALSKYAADYSLFRCCWLRWRWRVKRRGWLCTWPGSSLIRPAHAKRNTIHKISSYYHKIEVQTNVTIWQLMI